MTNSMFFRFVARTMTPILVMFSVYILLRGHNAPGGGFIGGLVAGVASVLMTLAYGADEFRRMLRIDFLRLMFIGLLLAASGGMIGLIFGDSFLEALFWAPFIRGIGPIELSTPLIFDIGVYVVVVGVTSAIVMAMAEESEEEDP